MPGSSLRPVGLALLAMLAAPAYAAPEPAAVADQIVAALAARGEAVATYETAVADGTSVIVTGVRIAQKDRENRLIELPEVRLDGVSERPGGGYSATSATFDGGTVVDQGRRIAWATAAAGEVILPSPDEIAAEAKIRPFAFMELTGVQVFRSTSDSPATTVDRAGFSMGAVAEGEPTALGVDASGITVTVDELVPGRRALLMKSLGYDTLLVDLTLAASFDPFADTLELDPLVVAVADLGTITVSGRFLGVSVGDFAAGSRRDEAAEAAAVEALSVRFDNTGVVERALKRQADAMGVEPDTFVENFLGAVPFMLNFIGNPPFQAKIADAARTFLREPRSVTFEAKPETPVSLESLVSAAATNRSALPDLLAVEVIANE